MRKDNIKKFQCLYMESSEIDSSDVNTTEKTHHTTGIKVVKKEKGGDVYYSINTEDKFFWNDDKKDEITLLVSTYVSKLLKAVGYKKGKSVLTVGVGNETMTADSLGARCVKRLEVTRHFFTGGESAKGLGVLSAIAGSVSGVTGVQSYDVISGVIEKTKPDIVIAIDTLSCSSIKRLQKVVQLTNVGLTPGSGVGNSKNSLSKESLGIPVIGIGVPLVIYAHNIVAEYVGQNDTIKLKNNFDRELYDLIVTTKEIDIAVEEYSKVLARAINMAVHGSGRFAE